MAGRIDYKASVEKDLRRVGSSNAARILRTIERKLVQDGTVGEPLHGEFAGLFRIRVGDDRVIYVPTQDGYLVLRIAHRREVYRRKT